MPYDSNKDLPDSVKDNLPQHAQEIYRQAFNSAWDEYADPEDRRGDQSREQTAAQVAWSAVKQEYEKDEAGNWTKKDG
jgi:cation transport regulator